MIFPGVNARRRRKLTIGKEETLLILRAYEQHPSQWKAIIDDIKANMDRLPNTHQQLYITATTRQLRDRISSEFTRIIYSNIDAIEDDDIRYVCLLPNYSECFTYKGSCTSFWGPFGPQEIVGLIVPPGKAYTMLTGYLITG